MAPSTFFFQPSTAETGFPDGAILCKAPRISELRNSTTAECETSECHTVVVSFWLVDPPGISYFSVNCPGVDASDFTDPMGHPWLICAEAGFVLFVVTVRRTTDLFLYTAGKQSLQLIPGPNNAPSRNYRYALLPLGGESYAVAFLTRRWISQHVGWQFHAFVFSSETQAWTKKMVSLQHLSEADKSSCGFHGLSAQMAVGGDSLAWVDLACGILLLQNIFHGNPVIRFIPFPESRVRFLDADGLPYYLDDYYCNVSCCHDLIKFVHIEFDNPVIRTNGQGWKATMWHRKLSWNNWHLHSTVDVADISVDPSYSALLPVLRDDEIQRLELKRLIFMTPVPSAHNDDIFYMMAKVNDEDDTAWAITIDMARASVEAMAPFSVRIYHIITMYRPCVFPKYLNMTPGAGMVNPVDNCFKRLNAKQCLMQVLWTLDWLRELDQCLEIERTTYNTCRLLLKLSPVSSLRSNIGSMVKCASFSNSQGEVVSKAVNFFFKRLLFPRALDDFDLALHESPSDLSAASIEAIRSKISDVLQALDNILRIVTPTLMPKALAIATDTESSDNESDEWQKGTSKPSTSEVGKYQESKGRCETKQGRAMVWWDGRLLVFIVCLLIIIVVIPSSPLTVRIVVSS